MSLADDDFAEGGGMAAEPDLPDPGETVAVILIRRLLDAELDRREQAAKLGAAVSVEVPLGAEWLAPVAAAWVSEVWNADIYSSISGPSRVQHARRGGSIHKRTGPSIAPCSAFLRSVAASPPEADADAMRVRRALSSGRAVIGFSQAPSRFLPADLVRAADLNLVLPTLDADTLVKAAETITGSVSTTGFPAELAQHVAVGDLWLACRPGVDAAAWLARLRMLVERNLAQVRTVGRTSLGDVAGMDEAVAWGQALARDLADYGAGRLPWSDVDRGCLLYGPPGTGKTTFARALARSCSVPLLSGTLAEWQAHKDGYLGDLLKAMRACFDEARRAAPCILFIDEVDGFGDRSKFAHRHRDYSVQVVNGLLECLDGLSGREGVVVVAACNDPNVLDPAIFRAGRLDRLIGIPLPNRLALCGILRHHLGADLPGADLSGVALGLLGGTGADVERAVRGARRRARHVGRPMLLDDLLLEVRSGPGEDKRSSEYRRIVAVHEAGHALLGALMSPVGIAKVTIRASNGAAGRVTSSWLPEHLAPTRARIDTALRRMLAGRAAEEILLGEISAGSGGGENSDLARATWLAAASFTAFGTEGVDDGLVWFGLPGREGLGFLLATRPLLARQVQAKLADAYAQARGAIVQHCAVVERIAELLLERETLEGAEVEALLAAEAATEEAATSPALADQRGANP